MNEVYPITDKDLIAQMKNYLKVRSFRDYLFFSMGIHSGLRVSDLLRLKVGHVRDQKHVEYVAQKTAKRRKKRKRKRFIIHPDYADDLKLYISGMQDDEYLFASRQKKTKTGTAGEPIRRETAWKMLNKMARHFGMKHIGCHSMRKTWGYQLIMNAESHETPYVMALLMESFGHESSEDTMRYIGLTQDMIDRMNLRLSYTQTG